MRGTIPVPAKDVHIFEKHFETFLEYVTQTDLGGRLLKAQCKTPQHIKMSINIMSK